AEHPIAVRSLADVELTALEIYVVPAQAAQFGRAYPRHGRGHQQRARALWGGCEDAPDLVGGGDIAAHFEAGLALVRGDAHSDRDILGDIAAALSLAKDPLKRG